MSCRPTHSIIVISRLAFHVRQFHFVLSSVIFTSCVFSHPQFNTQIFYNSLINMILDIPVDLLDDLSFVTSSLLVYSNATHANNSLNAICVHNTVFKIFTFYA